MKENLIRKKLAEKIDMPDTMLTECSLIKVNGNREIFIESYKGILKYSEKYIGLKAYPRNIFVTGDHLEIKMITDDILCISGEIFKIGFLNNCEE